MKKILIALLFCSQHIFADNVEVNGQFVIAPISSEKCDASAITAPTSALSSDSPLLEMVTSFLTTDETTSGIDYVVFDGYKKDDIVTIYSMDGQKQNELKRGINIVVDKQGSARKVLVK